MGRCDWQNSRPDNIWALTVEAVELEMPIEDNAQPAVTCIMPTANRRRLVRQAICYFQAQDYEPKELVIVDDGDEAVEDLAAGDARIRCVRSDRGLPLGAKRNLACREASHEIIIHWDDDDWMAPWRLSYQVSKLLQADADICGLSKVFFYDPGIDQAWQYIYPAGERFWVYGATLCYRKAFWRENPFPHINVGEDTRFVWSSRSERMLALEDPRFYVAMIHAGNTSPKQLEDGRYRPCPAGEIRSLMGAEWQLHAEILRAGGKPISVCNSYPSANLSVGNDGRL
jgi:glycosyltransferase involved in cell wall biosynthesis